MRIKSYYMGLILFVVGIASLSILIWEHESTKVDKLSQKIDSLLLLVSECGYSYERTAEITEILYNAQTKLIIENNYDNAVLLTNLAVGKLFSCQTDSQIENPYLILFPILILVIVFGAILILRKLVRQ